VESLPAGSVEPHPVERLLEGMSAHEIVNALAQDIAGLQERRLVDLVQRARRAALAGGPGTLGLALTRAALEEGRVERLLIADGTHDDGRGDEARLGERMIERALATGAEVTPVGGPAAAALGAHGGLAALLR
jgi:stalled ribosome rescue protein Dom34